MGLRCKAGLLLTILLACPPACHGPDRPGDRPAEDGARRIAVMAPAAVEMLAALECLDRVVAVGDFVEEPPAIASLPRIGAYDAPDVERLLELDTQVLITTASQAAAPGHRRLEQLGIEVVALDTSTYAGVFRALAEVGRVTWRGDSAAAIAESLRSELDEIRRRAAGQAPRRVLFVVGRDPVYVAGPGSHVDEMIAAVGGVNVAEDALAPYERFSMESLLERLPEVIIDTSDNREDAPRGAIAGSWGAWPFLPAVRDGRVYHVAPSRLVIPGMRLPEMTRLVGKLVRPEVFGEPAVDEMR